MTDVWVCTKCKSINRVRDSRCYSCGERKEHVAAPDGPDVRMDAALAQRSVNAYHSSLPFAFVAGALIAVVALIGVVLVFEAIRTLDELRGAFLQAVASGDTALVDRVLAEQRQPSTIGVLHFPLTVVAVLAFGAWLSRVCLNIPVLGGGTPTWTPVKALVYPIIPIVNFIKVPGMVQDAMYRLDPNGGGFFLVLAAFIGLVGSWLLGVLGTVAITANAVGAITTNPTRDGLVAAFGGVLDQTFILSVITELMTAAGAVLLIVIIARVESRAAAREREIQAVVLGAPAGAPLAQPVAAMPADAAPPVSADPVETAGAHAPQRSVPVYRPQDALAPTPPVAPPQQPASDDAGPLLPPPPPA
ncbi:MAG TPA: hypothetical protein VFQ75_05655 [Candidatus Limnocylindrales bacterium]|nr:hypothetical protein [Candidatus Limnocylindrales bacterium]